MEATYVLVGLLFIVLLVVWESRGDDEPHAKMPPLAPRRKATTTPKPFNRSMAKPQLSKPVIYGAAYVVDDDTIFIQKTQIPSLSSVRLVGR